MQMRTLTRLFLTASLLFGASYVAELRAGNELVGMWTQGPVNLPLTFTRGTK
jgi:hypothetical protein